MKHHVILSEVLNFSRLISMLTAIIIVFCAFTSVYTVKDGEIGILRTFGSITEITQAGIHFKLPYPIQQADTISLNKANTMEIGVNELIGWRGNDSHKDAEQMTKDGNILLINMLVEWKVTDPKAYLINAGDPDEILRNAVIAALRHVIGNSTVDSIMGSGKIDTQIKTKEQLDKLISMYNIGIQVLDVRIQEASPPDQVKKYFDNVSDAKVKGNTLISKAEDYRSQKIADAESEAKKISMEAEAYSEEVLNKAKAETSKFDDLYEQYKLSKEVTKTRLLLETLEEVLPGSNIYIVDDSNGDLKFLPIDKLEEEQ